MRQVTSPERMQKLALGWQRRGVRVGLVPTMGYLHEGHLSLVRIARRLVGPRGVVVASIYVNPTQFGPGEDLARYPRDLPRDLALLKGEGTDVVFTPDDRAMYAGAAEGRYSTYVVEESLSRGMEGASRPTHFRGVTTIVAKLFHLVLPQVAVFGAKDWQQAAIVRRMVADLNFPVRIVLGETVREPDGLAMSSRNRYLTPAQRRQATVLWRSIQEARERVGQGTVPAAALRRIVRKLVESEPDARLDYVNFFDPDSLETVDSVGPEHHMALAVLVGTTRLIDNAPLRPAGGRRPRLPRPGGRLKNPRRDLQP